ncbi:folylpolyglutamate synthase [Bacteroidia bacterium]|nr:folylpolyglutamate synthase [Bacteroidia bacterium]
MNSQYQETIGYLFTSLPMYSQIGAPAYKEGLDNALALDRYFGHPHRKFKSIHVAGTNGKGSVSHLLAAALQRAGYRVGLYTSPHLKDFGERIRVDGQMISKQFIVDFVSSHRHFFDTLHPSFFEMSVLMAFDYFAQNEVDVAVIEVGLGGRLDSTNIITPRLSVITNISLDHTNLLGNTLEKIAAEKAGIIKPHVPVVIGEASGGVRRVFEEKAARENATIYFAEEFYSVLPVIAGLTRNPLATNTWGLRVKPAMTETQRVEPAMTNTFQYSPKTPHKNWWANGEINIGLLGDYQQKNLTTSLTAVQLLNENGFIIPEKAVQEGFADVVKITGLRGRWQVLQNKPLTIADIGHNEAGIACVVSQLQKLPCKRLHIVFGVVNDKDLSTILPLLPTDAQYYFTKADILRALSETELQTQAEKFGLQGVAYSTVQAAFSAAKNVATEADVIFVGGSNFVVAEALN